MQIIKRTANDVEISLLGIVHLLWKKIWIILLCGVLFCFLAYQLAALMITPKYTAGITMYVNNSAQTNNSTSITTSDLTASAKLVNTYAAIISSNSVLTEVSSSAGLSISPAVLQKMIATAAVNNTEVFKVTVEDTDPARAATLANAIATVFPARVSEIVAGSSVRIIDYAAAPTVPSSPNLGQYARIGALLGILLSMMAIVIKELSDTSIKTEADLGIWNYPVLGVIPELNSAMKMNNYGYWYGAKNTQNAVRKAGAAEKSAPKRRP